MLTGWGVDMCGSLAGPMDKQVAARVHAEEQRLKQELVREAEAELCGIKGKLVVAVAVVVVAVVRWMVT